MRKGRCCTSGHGGAWETNGPGNREGIACTAVGHCVSLGKGLQDVCIMRKGLTVYFRLAENACFSCVHHCVQHIFTVRVSVCMHECMRVRASVCVNAHYKGWNSGRPPCQDPVLLLSSTPQTEVWLLIQDEIF